MRSTNDFKKYNKNIVRILLSFNINNYFSIYLEQKREII